MTIKEAVKAALDEWKAQFAQEDWSWQTTDWLAAAKENAEDLLAEAVDEWAETNGIGTE